MGNRGCLHEDGIIKRHHRGQAWITCTLNEKPQRGKVPQAAKGRYTPLFFLDEAVACAAGHKPCAECRHAVYKDFKAAWGRAFGEMPLSLAMNAILHTARLDGRKTQRRFAHAGIDLPDGVFIHWQGLPHLIRQDLALPDLGTGYGPPVPRPVAQVQVMTPAPLVAVMRAGWIPVTDLRQDRPNW